LTGLLEIVAKIIIMKPKKIWANFSVKDAKRTHEFYTQLGFVSNNPGNYPKLASFLFGDDDFVIHFFEEGSQIDEYLTHGPAGEVIFTLSAETENEIAEFADKVKNAGGKILKEVRRDEKGYYGFAFADPDGHRFNVLLLEGVCEKLIAIIHRTFAVNLKVFRRLDPQMMICLCFGWRRFLIQLKSLGTSCQRRGPRFSLQSAAVGCRLNKKFSKNAAEFPLPRRGRGWPRTSAHLA
jgi:predicted lactoylglutathione lyase